MKNKINYGKIGKQKFSNFSHTIKRLSLDERLKFDLLIAAGNSGQSMAKFTTMIFNELGKPSPPILEVPFFRYLPGQRENPDGLFNNEIFLAGIKTQLKQIGGDIRKVLFVDDEIGKGLTAWGVLDLLNEGLSNAGKPQIKDYYIVAEDQGFKIPGRYKNVKFIPYDSETEGHNNAIFYFTPSKFDKPLKKIFDEKELSFHSRTNLLLSLPVKEFNGGKPRYTTKFLKTAKRKIPDFQKLQEDYHDFIREAIKKNLKKA